MTVASSGEGATLDGKRETRLFHLTGGCSLTLRGLTLVNGRAVDVGGVVFAYGAGDVEIIESVVRDCSAPGDGVRSVELAATLQRRTAAGREVKRGHGCLTPLSPRNRSSGASSTRMRTAVRSR